MKTLGGRYRGLSERGIVFIVVKLIVVLLVSCKTAEMTREANTVDEVMICENHLPLYHQLPYVWKQNQ